MEKFLSINNVMDKYIKMKIFLFISCIFFVLIGSSLAQQQYPIGWSEPTSSDITDDMFKERTGDPFGYLKAKADFNGDGIIDTAILLINDKNNKMGLFVSVSSGEKFNIIQLAEMDDKTWVDAMGVSTVKPGKYKTACGKGYWECGKGIPEVLNLKYHAVNFFKFGSANSFFVYDKNLNEFKRIWISD